MHMQMVLAFWKRTQKCRSCRSCSAVTEQRVGRLPWFMQSFRWEFSPVQEHLLCSKCRVVVLCYHACQRRCIFICRCLHGPSGPKPDCSWLLPPGEMHGCTLHLSSSWHCHAPCNCILVVIYVAISLSVTSCSLVTNSLHSYHSTAQKFCGSLCEKL